MASVCRVACQFSHQTSKTKRHFIYDVIRQLGAECVEDYYFEETDQPKKVGKKQPKTDPSTARSNSNKKLKLYTRAQSRPTHLVLEPDADLSPLILLCKALGVEIVTPQWVYDAVQLGTLPAIVPSLHLHQRYGDLDREGAEEALTTSDFVALDDHYNKDSAIQRLNKEFFAKVLVEEIYPYGERWCRPLYKPILYNCCIHLVTPEDTLTEAISAHRSLLEGPMDALLQVTELIRVLGGTIGRSLDPHARVDLILNLEGFYTSSLHEESPVAVDTNAHPNNVCESLNGIVQSALQYMESLKASDPPEDKPVSDDNDNTSDKDNEAVPVVRIEWLVYSIVKREKVPIRPFIVRYLERGDSHQERAEKNEAHPMKDVFKTTMEAKTRSGPSTAVKHAINQLNTQQIHEL
ncbi:hypothetical protein ADEAN_000481700 [Angomonas deanei]|uniref:BRCT domain-containing protein n=1 Tax=Angomonas deanei TaxID=59799 RepID=A0A7G2CCT8_9TRYP|nr:hypothetical protein ADEAN_000481700 [Angomonas deanei]